MKSLVVGKHVLDMWAAALAAEQADQVLQIKAGDDPEYNSMLEGRFSALVRVGRWICRANSYLEVVREFSRKIRSPTDDSWLSAV